MHAIWTVFRKEFLENLRDRRTIFAALLFGPVFGPLLMALSLQLMADRGEARMDTPFTIAIAHAERAPNLVAFLRERGIDAEARDYGDAEARAAVLDKRYKAVLYVPADYGSRLAAGQPAALRLYADQSDTFNRGYTGRLESVLAQHGRGLANLRLLARGVDPTSVIPVTVQEIDVSTPASRAVLVLGLMSYLVIFATLMGGLYLAIDATAGERERGSLESLLTTPVPRAHLIYGKILATCAYMFVSLMLTVSACAVAVRFVRLEEFGMTANLGPDTAAGIVLLTAPLIPAGAALMTVIASFTKTFREAQNYLSFVTLVPTLPLAFVGMLGLKPSLELMAVPSLSQHFLMNTLLRGEAPAALDVAVSAGSSVALGLLLAWVAGRLYERESILG